MEKSKAFWQAKVKRIQHHQTSFTTNAKSTSLGRKHKSRKRPTENKPKTIKKTVIGLYISISSVQFSSVTQLCPTLCNPMNLSMPGLPVHHQHPESTQTHVRWVGDAIQPSHPLSSPSLPALNLSQYQGLFQWGRSSHQVAKVLEFQLQHQSFQWTPRADLL